MENRELGWKGECLNLGGLLVSLENPISLFWIWKAVKTYLRGKGKRAQQDVSTCAGREGISFNSYQQEWVLHRARREFSCPKDQQSDWQLCLRKAPCFPTCNFTVLFFPSSLFTVTAMAAWTVWLYGVFTCIIYNHTYFAPSIVRMCRIIFLEEASQAYGLVWRSHIQIWVKFSCIPYCF